MNRFATAGLVFLAFLALAQPSFAWWKSDWTVRRKITVEGAEAPGAATVLLRLHDGTYNFQLGKEDGSDLRFVAEDDKTLLPFHIERIDPLLDEAFVWVRVPDLKPGAKTSFFLYYGNQGNVTRADDPQATFDAETVLVYHFGENNAPPADASGKGNAGQSAASGVVGSLIGGGAKFDGHNRVTIPASASLTWGQGAAFTWSAWIKPGPPPPAQILFSRREENKVFLLGLDNGVPFVEVSGQRAAAGAALPAATWHQLAAVAEGGKITLYVDAEAAATLAAALPAFGGAATLGNDSLDGAAGYVGEMDELRLEKVARPTGYLRFAMTSQGGGDAAAKVVTYGDDEQSSNWFSGGTVGILMKSLTVDGWIVIGVLAVMGAVSWLVMISKVRYLNSISGSNRKFLEQWRHLSSDLTILDEGDPEQARTLGGRIAGPAVRKLRASPLYQIYHVGVEEIRPRVAAQPVGARQLSALSMQAVRASMDGRLVRESQKLGKLIVFLTLSISGGPFIGLLGTVIGVMITFASIAAAGDVNVNAIAPGIAAALVATVAGMGVAIPALFGYNYILSRVKDVTSDMHVFIDEFVTRAAEYYSASARSPRVRAALPEQNNPEAY